MDSIDFQLLESTVKEFAVDLVNGLSNLHKNSIIYADLKPSNVLLTEFKVLKLSDFGLAKKISDLSTPERSSNGQTR